MQGSLDKRNYLRNLGLVGTLAVGLFIGGALLGLILWSLALVTEPVIANDARPIIGIIAILVLAVGDIRGTLRNRLYPFAVRRQAKQTLAFRSTHGWWTNLVWGIDAGFSVGTYRVTSGLWIMATLILLGLAGPGMVFLYSAGFAVGYLVLVLWPMKRTAGESVNDAWSRRVKTTGKTRRLVQLAYLVWLPLAVGATLAGVP